MFARGNILLGADPRIPPHAFGLGSVLRQEEFKLSFAIVARLLPGTLPETVGILCGDESSPVLGIGAVTSFVERGFVALIVLNFENVPFSAQIKGDGLADWWSDGAWCSGVRPIIDRQCAAGIANGFMLGQEDPLAVSTFKHTGFS